MNTVFSVAFQSIIHKEQKAWSNHGLLVNSFNLERALTLNGANWQFIDNPPDFLIFKCICSPLTCLQQIFLNEKSVRDDNCGENNGLALRQELVLRGWSMSSLLRLLLRYFQRSSRKPFMHPLVYLSINNK